MRFDWSVAWTYRALLAQGMLVTVLLTVLTMAIAVPGGIVVMLMRQSGLAPLRAAAAAFVELFRNLPLILLVYWSFYVLPTLVDVQLSPFATALIALSLNVAAYNSETFRAGVNSIRRGQYDAALALGMSRAQVMRKVVLPWRCGASCQCSPRPGWRCSRTLRWSRSSRSVILRMYRCRSAHRPFASWRC